MRRKLNLNCKNMEVYLDTIADKDRQIQDLRVKVVELEEAAKPFEHKFGCDRFLCTCVAVKEPEVVMEENKDMTPLIIHGVNYLIHTSMLEEFLKEKCTNNI